MAHPAPERSERVWTVVVAGGSGQRFGGAKQYERLGGRRVLDWAVAAATAASDGVVVVVPADDVGREGGIAGGETRSESVRNGLEAVPGLSLSDTVKQVDADGRVVATPDRSQLRAVQTPQAFRATALRAAHDAVPAGEGVATDDATLVEAGGGSIVGVDGDADNRKITDPADLEWARRRLGPDDSVRVGQGFDIHRFDDDPARPLVLGGVTFEGSRGLAGHSDADAVAHAVTDALLGAAGLGDIGEHFPDTDPQFEGADSLVLLRHAVTLLRDAGWRVGNVDCSVVCEAPKLAPRRAEMQERLSEAAGAPVTVKGRRAEGLGALGRGEGIACWATAVITRNRA